MRAIFLKFHLWLWLTMAVIPAIAQQSAAGRIDETQGDVRIYDSAQNMRSARIGDVVYEGESIATGIDGEVHLVMADEGQIAIRPNTRLRIAKYKADGGKDDVSIIALVQGALRSVTGWIGKYNPKGYAIRTPTATIGVRGTDHETMVIPQGSRDGEAGTYDKVNHGATVLSTPHGETEVGPNQAGFVSVSGKAPPRLLPSVPKIYRPARLDSRFENLHEKVRQQIDVKRSQRIEAQRTQGVRQNESQGLRGAAGKTDGTALRPQQQRHEQAERQRQLQQQQFDERRKRLEEHRPGDARRLSGGEQRERRKIEAPNERPNRNDGNSPASGRGEARGGGHAGAGRNH